MRLILQIRRHCGLATQEGEWNSIDGWNLKAWLFLGPRVYLYLVKSEEWIGACWGDLSMLSVPPGYVTEHVGSERPATTLA